MKKPGKQSLWKSAIGWTCVAAVAFHFVMRPLLISLIEIMEHTLGSTGAFPVEQIPDIPWTEIAELLSTVFAALAGAVTVKGVQKS